MSTTRSVSRTTRGKRARSVSRWNPYPVDQAARAYSTALSLSLAFMFMTTRSANQSRTSYSTKIDPSSPPIIDTRCATQSICRDITSCAMWLKDCVSMVEVAGVAPASFRLYCCLSTTDILFINQIDLNVNH